MKFLLACLLFASPAFAQPFIAPLPDSTRIDVRRDLAFKASDGSTLRFDLFRPRGEARPPVVVIFNLNGPAGRTFPLSQSWARAFAGAGVAAACYEARTASADSDFDALLAHLAARGAELAIDGERVGVWAGSSNVSRALPLSADPARRQVRALVAMYGHGPLTAFRRDLPVLFVRAGLDSRRVLAPLDSLIARGLAQNAPVSVVNLPHGTHPFEESIDDDAARGAIARVLAFFAETLASGSTASLQAGAASAEANAALVARDWPRAIAAFEALAQARPNDFDLAQRVGDARLGAGDFTGAAAAYERALELGSWRKGELAMGAIAAYAQAGRIESARPWLDRLAPMWTNEVVLQRLGEVGAREDVRKLFESRVVH